MTKTSTSLDRERKQNLVTAVREHGRQGQNRLIEKIVSGKLRGAVSLEGAVEFWEGRGRTREEAMRLVGSMKGERDDPAR